MSAWSRFRWLLAVLPAASIACFALTASAADEDFPTLTKRLQDEKPKFAKRQQDLLEQRYDLSNRPAQGVTCHEGRPFRKGCVSSCLRG